MSQRTDAEKATRIRAEVALLRRLTACSGDRLQSDCPLCGGSVEMHVIRRDAKGCIEKSRGTCSTANCLEWNQ